VTTLSVSSNLTKSAISAPEILLDEYIYKFERS
jgi:hypothetical protein